MLTQQSRLRWVISLPKAPRLMDALSAACAPLLFGVRLWASVCLALFVAFWLELDNPFWAGTSAAIVCQPQLGASLRKGWFRMIGTVVGATMIVVLTAWFPQDRIAFLGLARPLGRYLRFRRHGAPQLRVLLGGARGLYRGDHRRRQPRRDRRARVRTSSCWRSGAPARSASGSRAPASFSPATDLGGAQRRLAASFANLAAEIMGGFSRTLALAGPQLPDTQAERREFVRRVIALDPMIDQTLGESSHVRYHSLNIAERRPRPVQSAGWLARSRDAFESLAEGHGSAAGGNHPVQHSPAVAIGAKAGLAGTLAG